MTASFGIRLGSSASLNLPFLDSTPPYIAPSGRHFWDLSAKVDAPLVLQVTRTHFSPQQDLGYWSKAMTPKALFFDMDSTVIEQESIVEMARYIGKSEEVSRITEAAMAGKIPFLDSLYERLALLNGVPATIFQEIFTRLTLTKGIEALLKFSIARGFKNFLVSGGFTDLAEPLARRLGFTQAHSNRLEVLDGKLTGKIIGAVIDGAAKASFVKEQMQRLNFSANDIIVVGDGANDIPMMALAGCAVGFRPKTILYPHVHVCVGSGDHLFLAELIGQN